MTIEMVLEIPFEKLHSYKKNVIEAELNHIGCGRVVNIKEELRLGIFNCDVLVYPKDEKRVLEARVRHTKKMFK